MMKKTNHIHKLIESNLFQYSKHMTDLAQGRCTSEEYVEELKKLRNSLNKTVKWLNILIKNTEEK